MSQDLKIYFEVREIVSIFVPKFEKGRKLFAFQNFSKTFRGNY